MCHVIQLDAIKPKLGSHLKPSCAQMAREYHRTSQHAAGPEDILRLLTLPPISNAETVLQLVD